MTTENPDVLAAPDGGSTGNIYFRLVILFILILVNAFFAMSEIAIISLNDNKIDKLAGEGHKKARQILRLTANSSGFLSTIQIGVTLAGFLTSASAAEFFSPILANAFVGWFPALAGYETTIGTLSLVLVTLIMSYFSLVLGELVPKRIAMQKAEKVSYAVVGVLLFINKITTPFVKILSLSTNGVIRLIGLDPNADEEQVTEEEILMMVDVGEEKGVIENAQREMINNIFEFDDIDAGDIMTHRVDITAVEADEPVSEVVKAAIEDGYSRIPVYDDDPDNIVGIVYIKDLLKYIGQDMPTDTTIRYIMREAYFVPETKRCGELFNEMIEKHMQMAIIIDEFGGTAGLVTIEDLVEAIVGNIQDEYDEEEDEISQINDSTFTVDGVTDIEEVDDLVGAALPEGDYDTIGGFIISQLGYLPVDGDLDIVTYENLIFTVLSVEDRRIGKIKIEILPRNEEGSHEKTKKEDAKDKPSEKKRAGKQRFEENAKAMRAADAAAE
jgi:putative hemolysin